VYGNKKRQGNLTLPFLLLSGRATFCAESGRGTPVAPLHANPLASRVNYEAAATAATTTTATTYVINSDSFT
jgi:hypothetical protein